MQRVKVCDEDTHPLSHKSVDIYSFNYFESHCDTVYSAVSFDRLSVYCEHRKHSKSIATMGTRD